MRTVLFWVVTRRVGNSLPKFRDNLSVEMSVRNYHHPLRNNPEEHSPYKISSYYFVSSYVSSMKISPRTTECGFQEFTATHSKLLSHKLILSIPVVTTCSNRFNIQQHRQCTYKCNTKSRSCKHCCSGEAISITYCVCVCIPSYPAHSAHVRYCHPWLVRLCNIFPLSHKRQDILKRKFFKIKRMF